MAKMMSIKSLLLGKGIWACGHPKTESFRTAVPDVRRSLRSSSLYVDSDIASEHRNCFESDSSSASTSPISSSEDCSSDSPESLEVLVSGLCSQRFFFEPDCPKSFVKEDGKQPKGRRDQKTAKNISREVEGEDRVLNGTEEMPFRESLMMAMESEDPYMDFKVSMEEMVDAYGFDTWACLEEMLAWYLKLNAKGVHGYIVGAFVDLMLSLVSDRLADHHFVDQNDDDVALIDTIPSLVGGVRKGAWSREEDKLLRECVEKYGVGNWHLVPSRAGLRRCRKSCRLRWLNYLCPKVKRGEFSEGERDLIIRLHRLLGNRWSLIAGGIPGRTANDVKNYWNSRLCKPQSVASMTEKKPIAPIRKKAKAAREDQEPIRRPTVLVVKPQAHRIKMKPPHCFRKSDAASSRSSQLGEFLSEDRQCSPSVLQNNLPAENPAIHESKPDDDDALMLSGACSGGGHVFTSSDQVWNFEGEADLEMWNLLQPDTELHEAQWDQDVQILDAEIWECTDNY